jgi:hypothetical protein
MSMSMPTTTRDIPPSRRASPVLASQVISFAFKRSSHPIDVPHPIYSAEYLAKGYHLSDSILQRTSSLYLFCHSPISLIAVNSNGNNRPVGAIEIDQKQGISTRFLEYIKTLDHTVGSKAIGPHQTVSGKLQETITHLDEQHSIKKQAEDVNNCFLLISIPSLELS